MGMSLSKLRETVEDRGAWCAVVHEVAEHRTRLNDQNSSPLSGATQILSVLFLITGKRAYEN